MIDLFSNTAINSVVIDIKDASGRLSYQPADSELRASGVGTNRISDLPALTALLHEHGIYIIGRLTVFQDPFYANGHLEDTFIDTRTNGVWRDYKGIAWLRPNSEAVWKYISRIAHDAYDQGFDEINLDYVRFPSDGELKFLDLSQFEKSRAHTIEDFFAYLDTNLRGASIPLSADVFGLTMSAKDDLGIGQIAELIAPHVDYLCPMVYPSHFALGSYGIATPAVQPYQIIHRSLSDGIKKMIAIGVAPEKIRPWLQDFDLLGVPYTTEMLQAQVQATNDVGLHSWLFWNPKNNYSSEVFGQL